MMVVDNLQDSYEFSGCSPVANATALQPNGYSRRLTPLQRSRRPRSGLCNLLIPNGTTDHTQTFGNKNLQIATKWRGEFLIVAKRNSDR